MVRESDVNFILTSIYEVFEEKLPFLGMLSLGGLERTDKIGSYGSIVLALVLLGDIEGKVTLVFEWDLALSIAKDMSQATEGTQVQEGSGPQLLEPVGQDILNRLREKASQLKMQLDGFLLPTLIDSSFLLEVHEESENIKVQIITAKEPITLFLSLKYREGAHDRAA